MNKRTTSLTNIQAMAYGLPMFSFAILLAPSSTLLPGIYAKHFGITLTTIATVLLIARLFDAITDPLIGYFTDKYYARRGSRRPFIVVGVLLFIISSWFLYVPYGVDASQGEAHVSTGYFLVWFLLFYLTQTLFEIPHMAWGSELAGNSREKNIVYSLRSLFGFLGGLLFFVIPFFPWFASTDVTPQTLKWAVVLGGLLMLLMFSICIKYTPSKSIYHPAKSSAQESLKVVLSDIVTNKPFWVLTAAHICTGFGSGMCFSLIFIFIDTYLGLGAQFALVFVISTCLKVISLRFWFMSANRWGKQATWSMGMLLVILGMVGMELLSPERSGWFELSVCVTLFFSGFAAFHVMVPSLVSDIADYGIWKSSSDRTATYFSLYIFINKSVFAFGGALALALAGWFGFDPRSTTHSDQAITGLRLAMVWLPLLFIVLSIVFITRIPITTRRYDIIRRALDRRANRAEKPLPEPAENTASSNPPSHSNKSDHLAQT